MKPIQEKLPDVETQQPIDRRSLLLAAIGGATAIGTLGLSEPTLASHSGIPHITDVTEFGATGDGTTNDTDAIQAPPLPSILRSRTPDPWRSTPLARLKTMASSIPL